MENYLSGRGAGEDIDLSKNDSSFRPFLSQAPSSSNESNLAEPNLASEADRKSYLMRKIVQKLRSFLLTNNRDKLLFILRTGVC